MHELGQWVIAFLSFYAFSVSLNINTHVILPSSNLGFGHSGEGTAQYADQSGMMGYRYSYSLDEGPVMVRKDVIIL